MSAAWNALISLFTVKAGEYEHLRFTADNALWATVFIWAACAGIIIASFYAFYQQRVPGSAVRAILRADALDPARAKTAEELGLRRRGLVAHEIRTNKTLRRFIQIESGEGEPRYFIPEEKKYRAEVRFDKKGNGVLGVIFTTLLAIGLGLAFVALFPSILQIVNNLMG